MLKSWMAVIIDINLRRVSTCASVWGAMTPKKMSTKKKKATAKASSIKDLGAKKNPKGGAFDTYLKVTGSGKNFLNPQPLPP